MNGGSFEASGITNVACMVAGPLTAQQVLLQLVSVGRAASPPHQPPFRGRVGNAHAPRPRTPRPPARLPCAHRRPHRSGAAGRARGSAVWFRLVPATARRPPGRPPLPPRCCEVGRGRRAQQRGGAGAGVWLVPALPAALCALRPVCKSARLKSSSYRPRQFCA